MGASAAEKYQRDLGQWNVQAYLDRYAPLESTLVNQILSRDGEQAELGRTNVDAQLAGRTAIPLGGRGLAQVQQSGAQRGLAAGLGAVQTKQNQLDRRLDRLNGGLNVGRQLMAISSGAQRTAAVNAFEDAQRKEAIRADRKARIWGMAGEAIGAGLGAYGQYKAAPKTQHGGGYYTQNGNTYWNDGTLADDGTSFVD